MPIEAVIFDLDGTLATFNLDYKALRGEVRETLLHAGVPASVLSVKESLFEMLEKAELYFKNGSKSEQAFKDSRLKCLAIAEKYEMEAAALTGLQSGAMETLKELKKLKVKIGLCTISSETATNYILQRFKIADYFQVVVSREKVKHVKPDTEQLELALKTLGVKPNAAVIVGDSAVDMQSAKDLKSVAVGIPTGIATQKQLTTAGANYIITALSDLPLLIKKIDKD
ncbi:MAG TPA: HAD family phosphatase [Candidatus Acidoferrales bacterium]|nr:HAD family phosphatase [Candidatus Acidoferrales bacterium]